MLVTLYTASVIVGVGAARKFIFFEIFLFLIVGDPTLFSHLWYVHRSLISDTPNPEIPGCQLRIFINKKPNDKQK